MQASKAWRAVRAWVRGVLDSVTQQVFHWPPCSHQHSKMAKKQAQVQGQPQAIRQGSSPTEPASSATAKPLPKGPHTLQLAFHLLTHALLLLLTTIVLPSHLLTRSSQDESISSLSFLSSIHYFFSIPQNEEHERLIRKCTWGAVQGVVLIQGWALMRYRKWFELGNAIRTGDRGAAKDVTARGWAKSAELLTLSSVSLPGAFALIHSLLIAIGAPATSQVKATAQLSLAITLLVAFPLLHVLPNDMDIWTRLLGLLKPASKQETTLLITTLLPLVTAFVFSASLTFDHGLAWSSTFPVPTLIGLFVGAIAADLIALPLYIFSS